MVKIESIRVLGIDSDDLTHDLLISQAGSDLLWLFYREYPQDDPSQQTRLLY